MRVMFDAEADAGSDFPVPDLMSGPAVRTSEVRGNDEGMVVLDFDADGVLLGVKVSTATILDGSFLAGAERIDQQ